jgi:thioesterase domain-containing protein
MIIQDLIKELKEKNIEISFCAGKLRYSGPEENITPDVLDKLKKNKGKLIKYFWPEELSLMMPINTEGTKTPLFIVHGDYANYAISEYLGPDQPVYGFFHPGSEGEAFPFKNVNEMAKIYLEKVLTVFPAGPFYLMGFSFGGTLAYEMAIQLQKAGQKVPFLVLLDSFSPLALEPEKWHTGILKIIRKNILGPLSRKTKQFIKQSICESYILLNKQIPVIRRSDYIAYKYLNLARKYSPEKFDGDILLFRTSENRSPLKYLGWDNLVKEIRMIEIKGSHLEIFTEAGNTNIVQTETEKYLIRANSLL